MKKILNIAHRGFSSEYPENTMIAFDEAMKAGADGFECDLRLTSDGRVVVFHDDNLKRLCGKLGTIESMTFKEVQTLKVKKSEPIPSLEELLTTFHTTRINLEIKKSGRDAEVVESVLRVVTKIRPQGEILFSSFSIEALKALKVMDLKRTLGKQGLLVESKNLLDVDEISTELEPDTYNLPKQVLSRSKMSFSKAKPIWLWTLDEPDEWDKAIKSSLPIAAIITNKPAALKAFLR